MVKQVKGSIAIGTRISPKTARALRSFAKKNKMSISHVVDSAVQYFIDESNKLATNKKGDKFDVIPYTADAQRHSEAVNTRVRFATGLGYLKEKLEAEKPKKAPAKKAPAKKAPAKRKKAA